MQSAKSLSDMHFVPLAETERWVSGHQETYPDFHAWAKEQMHIAESRGWSYTSWWRRCRFVGESNAKGSGESPGVMGLNHKVQGTAADISKAALIKCKQLINQQPHMRGVEIIGQVHDSILFEGPGALKLDLAGSEYKDEVLIKPKWIVPASVYEWAMPLKQAMIDAETECFNGLLEGRVGDPCISQYWAKD